MRRILGHPQLPQNGNRLRGERFVQFDDAEVGQRQAGLLELGTCNKL